MTTFRSRLHKISIEKHSPFILACDYDINYDKLLARTNKIIILLHKYLCAIKINFHLLLPFGKNDIINLNKLAHQYNLQTIADIKLNDIFNTNKIAIETLFNFGFDAIIVNPIVGQKNISKIINIAHKTKNGIITICHLSSPDSKLFYESPIILNNNKQTKLYELLLNISINAKTDGVIIGATFPHIIKYCKSICPKNLDIYSPGIGVQGGDISQTISAGANFLIIGRSIISSQNPLIAITKLYSNLQKISSFY